jgi:XRE family transcriptional regulator, aerobic/anaerobic benzoate catabolism transcriptional regulator
MCLMQACLTVWVKASPEQHMQRVMDQGDLRPMRDNRRSMADLRAILSSREALYAQADLQLDTTGRDVEATLEALTRAVTG